MSQIDNILIQVRARLQSQSIKLWTEPYFFEDLGVVESAIDDLSENFSKNLGITTSQCKMAIMELQSGALSKLAARKEFDETGVATFSVRHVSNKSGTQCIVTVKCHLSALGSEFHKLIAEKLGMPEPKFIKVIYSGKILDTEKTLEAQGLKNNQQLMAIVNNLDLSVSRDAVYERIHKIKMDVESIVDSSRPLFEMEDQDGNPIFLPPDENRSILVAMSYCEKARVAMKRNNFEEALILLLEADEMYTKCNSKFLEAVDNYALVNLDIVWCYLCLKNITQLPDAQRRLEICEKSFNRSYGENMHRVIALRGTACPERALILRLHVLKGVVFFHQNQRDQAYEMFQLATEELFELKVDDHSVEILVEMGYKTHEARIALRSVSGNVVEAIKFIDDRKKKIEEARKRTKKERDVNRELGNRAVDQKWVNPKSVCRLVEMGFNRNVVVEALRKARNDQHRAIDLLQNNMDELLACVSPHQDADNQLLDQLLELGFSENVVRIALETTQNQLEEAITFLIGTFPGEDQLNDAIERMTVNGTDAGPSTSTGFSNVVQKILNKAKAEIESMNAYKRFNEDLVHNDQDYLDLSLEQEEEFLNEYKKLLA